MLVYPPPLNIKSAQPLEINYLILWGSTIMYQEYLLLRGCGGFSYLGEGDNLHSPSRNGGACSAYFLGRG